MYIEIENIFERVMFWAMWFGTDAIILFFAIIFFINCIQEHKKAKWAKTLYHDVFIVDKSKTEIVDKEDKEK